MVYSTKLWEGTHPSKHIIEEIMERFMPTGESKLYLSKVKAANPKIKRLRELIRKHYRFYNDGDSFTISGLRAGYEGGKYGREHRYYYQTTDRALMTIENEIADLARQIYTMTASERSRPVDQYGRIHRHQGLPKHLGF